MTRQHGLLHNLISARPFAALFCAMLCVAVLLCSCPTQTFAQASAEEVLHRHSKAAAEAMQRLDYVTAEREYLTILQLAPKVAEVQNNLGLAYYLQGKYDPAAEQFQRSLEIKPSLYAPNYFLARIRYKQGRFREALPLLERALTLQPENIEARRQLASTHVALKEFRRAITLYRSCLKNDPRQVEVLYDLGMVYMKLAEQAFDHVAELPSSAFSSLIKASHYANLVEWGQSERGEWNEFARSEYRSAIEKAPHLPELRARLGELELKEGNWEAAAELFEQEIEVDPSSYVGRYGLAQVFFHRQDLAKTLRHLNEAARIRPEFFNPLPAFRNALPKQELNLLRSKMLGSALDGSFGRAFLQAILTAELGDAFEETAALRTAEKLLVELRDQVSVATPIAQTNTNQVTQKGLQLLQGKRYEAGTSLVLPLAMKADLAPELLVPLARALLLLKEYDIVGEILDPYANRHPDDPEPYYLLGLSYQDAATEIMQVMVKTDPQSYRLRLLMGDAFFAQERYQDSVKEYQAALDLQPGNSDLYFRLGRAYHSQMRYEEALEYFRQSVESDPRNAPAQLKLGDSMLQVRKPEEALSHLRAALALDSSLIEAHAKLGKALAMLDRFEDAVHELELASGLDRDGSLHYQLGTFYRRRGQEDKAVAAFKKSQELRAEQLKKQELQTLEATKEEQ